MPQTDDDRFSGIARGAVAAAPGELPSTGAGYRAEWSAWARALLLEASGELAQALETLSGCWDRCARSGLAVEYPVIGPDLVRLARAAGDVGRAREVAAAVTGMASRNQVPWITGAALRCQGLAENDADILQAAVDACARGSRPIEFALTCEDAGAAFARRGNVSRAGHSSIRRSPSTSASTPRATSPAPRPPCGRWESVVAAT